MPWKEVLTLPDWPAFAPIALSPDGRVLASSGPENKKVVLRDTVSGRELRSWECEGVIALLEFPGDGKTVVCLGAGFADFRDAATGNSSASFGKHDNLRPIYDFRLSADGKTAAITIVRAFETIPQGSELIVHDIVGGKETGRVDVRGEFRGNTASYIVPKMAPGFDSLLTYGHVDGTTHFWDLATKKPRGTLATRLLVSDTAVYSSDGQAVAVHSHVLGTPLQVWDVKTRKLQKSFRQPKGTTVNGWTWSPDSRLLAVGCGSDVLIWDWAADEVRATLSFPKTHDMIRPVTWAAGGRFLAAAAIPTNPQPGAERGLLRIWETAGLPSALPKSPSEAEK